MWSAAVLEPALPGRSSPANWLPGAGLTVIAEHQQRMATDGLLPGLGRVLFLGMSTPPGCRARWHAAYSAV
jgi:hypothetical protein